MPENGENINYLEIESSEDLFDDIKCFWMYENKDKNIHHTIFPNGCFELMAVYENEILYSILFSGLKTKPFDVFVPQGVTIYSIRFKLSASEFIFQKEIGGFLDKTVTLESSFWNIEEFGFLPFEKFANIISENIFQISQKLPTRNVEKENLLKVIYTSNLKVKDIVGLTGWSSRKINRYFTKQFGLPLKTFLNIIRIRNSFSEIKKGEFIPEEGYFDQSHFIKETKKYMESTPKKLSENENDRFLQLSVNKDD